MELTENGRVSEIEGEWMNKTGCEATVASTTVSLQSFKTLFGITGGITTICITVFLVRYLCNNRESLRRILTSSSATIWSKIGAICKHFDERDPKSIKTKQDTTNANQSSTVVVPVDDVDLEAPTQ